jgi:hypothetical protein
LVSIFVKLGFYYLTLKFIKPKSDFFSFSLFLSFSCFVVSSI